MSRDFDKAQEMVVASMEYIKVLGFRIRRTEVQRDDWKLVAQSHADELIKLRQRVDELKAERDAAKQEAVSARQDAVTRENKAKDTTDSDIEEMVNLRRKLGMVTPIERLKKPRQHPVKVGEWVLRTGGGGAYPIGTVAQVNQYSPSGDYLVRLAGQTRIVIWFKQNCTPCDPPEATHDTPEGKQAAEGALPQPGDVVRLVRLPTVKDCSQYDYQDSGQLPLVSTQVNTLGKVVGTAQCEACARVSVDDNGTIKAWPLSCIEVVKGGE